MIKPILVITDKCDVHADFVVIEIRKNGGDIIRMNTQEMGNNSDFFWEKLDLEKPGKLKLHLKDSGKTLTADSFDTIWYRKPEPVDPIYQRLQLFPLAFFTNWRSLLEKIQFHKVPD